MSNIFFHSMRITDATRLDLICDVTDDNESNATYPLWFESSQPLTWDGDSIALSLSTLCGRAYSGISIETGVTESVARAIGEHTRADVKVHHHVERNNPPSRNGIVLNFSGGFDSLAALCLMPSTTNLVSLDFGGYFAREREFFSRFNTTIISTNLTETPLRSNSWSFMGIGSLLTSGIHLSKYISFGGILENTADGMRKLPDVAQAQTFAPFSAAGYTNAAFVAGVTEIGTTAILLKARKDEVLDSLNSLAGPGAEKMYRKSMLTKILADRLDLDLEQPEPQRPRTPQDFGQSFTADFVALYIGRFAGKEARDAVVVNVPDDLDRIVDSLDFDFAEKVNTTLYRQFPRSLMGGLAKRFYDIGIPFYEESDWDEFRLLRNALSAYYPELTT